MNEDEDDGFLAISFQDSRGIRFVSRVPDDGDDPFLGGGQDERG